MKIISMKFRISEQTAMRIILLLYAFSFSLCAPAATRPAPCGTLDGKKICDHSEHWYSQASKAPKQHIVKTKRSERQCIDMAPIDITTNCDENTPCIMSQPSYVCTAYILTTPAKAR